MKDIKHMDIKEFVERGFLQEANRLFFHPHGLALEVFVTDDGMKLAGIWDSRDDPEGIVFDDLTTEEAKAKAKHVSAEWTKHAIRREEMFGSDIQPIGSKWPKENPNATD